MGRPVSDKHTKHIAVCATPNDLRLLAELRALLDAGNSEIIRRAIRHFHAASMAGKATP